MKTERHNRGKHTTAIENKDVGLLNSHDDHFLGARLSVHHTDNIITKVLLNRTLITK